MLATALIALTAALPAAAATDAALAKRELRQQRTLWRYTGTLRFFAAHRALAATPAGRVASHRARVWLRVTRRELAETRVERQARRQPVRSLQSAGYWAAKQIAAAEVIGRESGGDPWPNCPDPFDGGGSWSDTVACENGGNWLDSPGYYRCGLQFDPGWERRFGRLCP